MHIVVRHYNAQMQRGFTESDDDDDEDNADLRDHDLLSNVMHGHVLKLALLNNLF